MVRAAAAAQAMCECNVMCFNVMNACIYTCKHASRYACMYVCVGVCVYIMQWPGSLPLSQPYTNLRSTHKVHRKYECPYKQESMHKYAMTFMAVSKACIIHLRYIHGSSSFACLPHVEVDEGRAEDIATSGME